MFHSINNPGGSHRVCEVDGDYQHPGGAAKRVRELGGGITLYCMILFTFLLTPPDTSGRVGCAYQYSG
jgi:hypothetical protein